MMNSPILRTENLILRAIDIRDASAMFAYRSRKSVSRYQSWQPTTQKEVRSFIQKYCCQAFLTPNTWFQLGIYLQPADELIGDIGLHFLDESFSFLEIGYTISPLFQCRGYAFEAVIKVREHLFNSLNFKTLIAIVDQRNKPSVAFLLKLGFVEQDIDQLPIMISKMPDDMLFIYSMDDQ